MKLRSFLSLSFAFVLSLTSANAYTLEQSPVEIEAAVLLNDDGTPRCWVGQAPELDDLRECDESDVPEGGEINLGAVALPSGAMTKAWLASAAVGSIAGCALGTLTNIASF